MPRRREGTGGPRIAAAMGWAPHTVRGFLAGLAENGIKVEVLDRVRQVGCSETGAKGSYTVYASPMRSRNDSAARFMPAAKSRPKSAANQRRPADRKRRRFIHVPPPRRLLCQFEKLIPGDPGAFVFRTLPGPHKRILEPIL
jgi:hypothetical protein